MRGRYRALLVAGVVAASAGCPNLSGPPLQNTIWDAQLVPDSSQPNLAGTAAMVTQLGGTDVGIGITGAQPGALFEWRVYNGTCATPGPAASPQGDYASLPVDDTGGTTGEAHINRLLAADSTYYVEVRASPTDTSRVACGDFHVRPSTS